ncbi:unnamed protein product [Didymodactylos carnosus]|nr:unnamed protein product [Didymodactylos carnosus]CAF4224665.1 unnamed protein product [Didymodactylos carnosus]
MAKRFFENASHVVQYAAYRPTYSQALIEKIMNYLSLKYKGDYDIAIDIGCGSGQSTKLLSPYFQQVYGYDVSKNQIKQANEKNTNSNVKYRSENIISHDNNSLCLVTVAQAAHWFNLQQFYSEAHRTLKLMGVLAVYGYGFVELHGPQNKRLNEIVTNFYRKVRPFFPDDRIHIDNKYSSIILPYVERERDESVKINCTWDIQRLLGYICTWSGYQNYVKLHPNNDIINDLRSELFSTLNTTNESEKIELSFDTFILMGRKTSNDLY